MKLPLHMAFVAVLVLSSSTPAESVSVLLEKGIYTEDTVGDVDAAIKIYEQILTEARANRRYVAQAHLRLGMCYLKKKQDASAEAEFEKLIAEFPEQTQLVAEARKHLPTMEFPEIDGCRVVKRIAATLGTADAPALSSPAATIYADDVLEFTWTASPDILAKTQSWQIGVATSVSDDHSNWPWWTTIKDVSVQSARYGTLRASEDVKPLKPGDYIFSVTATNTGDAGADSKVLAFAEVKFTIKPTIYTQINIDSIQPEGTLQGRNIIHQLNSSNQPLTILSFINSDFVQLTSIMDEQGKPIEFTTKQEKGIYRYKAKLNVPVAPGETLIHASESTKSGLVNPVRGKPGVYEYRMQHSPNSSVPTRRIEVFRLPAGAEVIETAPATMTRRVKDGHTELAVEKTIAAGGSLLTRFSYRLSGGASQPATKPALALKPAPWADGEELQLRILSPAGAEFGTIIYRSDLVKHAGKVAWLVESQMVVSVNNMLQYTSVFAERDSYAPMAGVTRNNLMGDFEGTYGRSQVKLTSKAEGKESTRNVNVDGPVYDNEQVLYLMRRMPLTKGYQARFDIFPLMSGTILEGRINVTTEEPITVPAGTYDCCKIALSVYMDGTRVLEHQVWMSADAHQYLVKYDSGSAIMELTRVATVDRNKPALFSDPDLKISLEAPTGWCFYRNVSKDSQATFQLLAPELKAWCLLATQVHSGEAETSRLVAEGDVQALKGFFKGYKVRPASWTERKVSGLPATRFEADYQDESQEMVEYRTYIVGEKAVYWFVFRIEKDKFQEMKPTFDKVVDGFKVTQ